VSFVKDDQTTVVVSTFCKIDIGLYAPQTGTVGICVSGLASESGVKTLLVHRHLCTMCHRLCFSWVHDTLAAANTTDASSCSCCFRRGYHISPRCIVSTSL
jgi:hypothetical protein